MLLVLLRMAIGWHIGYEGLCKLDPRWADIGMPRTSGTPKSFSAEGYLRNSTGPLRDRFRELIADRDGLTALKDPEPTIAVWESTVRRFDKHFEFSDDQRVAAQNQLDDLKRDHRAYLAGDDLKNNLKLYEEMLTKFKKIDDDPEVKNDPLTRQLAEKQKTEVEAKRRELIGPIDGWSASLDATLNRLLSDEQRSKPAPMKEWNEMTDLEKVNLTTKWGLTTCGVLMFVGLFSRLASFGSACFLGLFYAAAAFPGLTPAPLAEGTYLIVNKNLIEMIACLALATAPTGVWGGLDALIRGMFTRPVFRIGESEVRPEVNF